MSDTPVIPRVLGGAEEFERRMRMIGKPTPSGDDPLAELARLVGQEDPFKGVFPASRAAGKPQFATPPADASSHQHAPVHAHEAGSGEPGREDFSIFDHDFRPTAEMSDQAGAPVDPAIVHGEEGEAVQVSSYAPSIDGRYPRVEVSPDAWAQGHVAQGQTAEGQAAEGATTEVQGAVRETLGEPRSHAGAQGSPRRTLVVLAAVVVLTGGGLGASFLARPSGSAAALGIAAPTIMAATGPNKVQPPAPAATSAGSNEPSTLLDKNKNDGTATAKVVNSAEQPVDLALVAKQVQPDETARRAAVSASPFPEPRKVKTIMVRPDGTIIAAPTAGQNNRLADVTGTANQQASLAFDARTAMPLPGRDAPASEPPVSPTNGDTPATPAVKPAKTTIRAATTPRGPAQAAAGDTGAATLAVQPMPAPTQARAKPKPVEEASAASTPDSGASTSGGGYAVQLGAPPSQQDAKDTSLRLQKKFADQLGAYRPSIYEAKSGDKSVFRIRVGNLSLDAAKGLCSKLQSGGGSCFVVRN